MKEGSELDQFLETPESAGAEQAKDVTGEEAAQTDVAKQPEDKGKGEQPNAETPSAEKDESTAKADGKPHWSESAYLDEKRKRQELERQLAEVSKKPEPEKPDIFSDPDGYDKHVQDAISRAELRTKVNISVELMREKHADYDEAEKAFVEMAKGDPSLVAKMNASALPAKFVYDHVQRHKAMQEIGDPVAYREKLKQELLAELKAAKPEEPQKPEKTPIEKTPSLATASAAASNTSVVTPELEEMFER